MTERSLSVLGKFHFFILLDSSGLFCGHLLEKTAVDVHANLRDNTALSFIVLITLLHGYP